MTQLGLPSDDDVVPVEHDPPVDGALMLSFGGVVPGREKLAVETFTEVGRHLGLLMDAGVLASFRPYFFADGMMNDISGFFLLEGRREQLDALRREEAFARLILLDARAPGVSRLRRRRTCGCRRCSPAPMPAAS